MIKKLLIQGKPHMLNNPGTKNYEVIDNENFEQSDVKFSKEFLLKCKKQ